VRGPSTRYHGEGAPARSREDAPRRSARRDDVVALYECLIEDTLRLARSVRTDALAVVCPAATRMTSRGGSRGSRSSRSEAKVSPPASPRHSGSSATVDTGASSLSVATVRISMQQRSSTRFGASTARRRRRPDDRRRLLPRRCRGRRRRASSTVRRLAPRARSIRCSPRARTGPSGRVHRGSLRRRRERRSRAPRRRPPARSRPCAADGRVARGNGEREGAGDEERGPAGGARRLGVHPRGLHGRDRVSRTGSATLGVPRWRRSSPAARTSRPRALGSRPA